MQSYAVIRVAGNGCPQVISRIYPNVVPPAVAEQSAAVVQEVALEIATPDQRANPWLYEAVLALPLDGIDNLDIVKVRLSLTAIYEPVEDGWTQARIAELPAVVTAAPTLEEARELLLDALREYLLSFGDQENPLPIQDSARREPLELVLSS